MGGIMLPIFGDLAAQGTSTPSQIPGLNLWYDASVSTTSTMLTGSGTAPTNNQAVKSWIDKLGNGRNADQATGNRQPLWLSSQQNGLGTLKFDGTNDSFTLNPISWALALPGQTTYVVVKLAAIVDQMHVCATNTGGFTFNVSGTSWAIETAGAIAVSGQAANTASYAYMGMVFDGTQTNANITLQNNARLKYRYNGVQQSLTFSTNANTTTSPTANTLNVGADDAGNAGYLNGFIGELMIWTRTLSAAEINQVETYLKNKWGI